MSSIEGFAASWIWSRVFTFRPKVSKVGQTLVACSDLRSQLFCLGLASRKVTVDPGGRTVRIALRKFWFARTSRRLEFDWVESVVYGYYEVSPSLGAHQEQDLFTVALRLKNGQEVVLFRFYGAGDFVNNGIWPDWMYWDDFALSPYLRGDQEAESALYADLVARMIGVPLVNPSP